ncbi:cobalamin B12-binding domain-containing protein [Salidesulfovibrio brasiliensis]|uniref:cobalamin B12-binding domain-containing protein n=1 Tax=Salidesulfovibrio brasiliensis TaxID=221711 RepID=UPI0006CFBF20|nr:cobalamin-dependent protein [Salidesulfovibrio brasiliensis]
MTEDRHADTAQMAEQYQHLLLEGNRDAATRLVMEALDGGLSISRLYLEVFQHTQHRIGDLWQANRISVAMEHYCTAATQLIMASIFPRIMGDGSANRTVVGCCANTEIHELGIRMVCDFFEMENWTTQFLGSGMPNDDVVSFLDRHNADVLCISCTTTYNTRRVKELIDAVRSTFGHKAPPVMVGGRPFTMAPDLVSAVGADAWAPDALQAVKVGKDLTQ